MNEQKESNQEYSEKIWTKEDGKIDGYVFKGKHSFANALKGLRGIMRKGVNNETSWGRAVPSSG